MRKVTQYTIERVYEVYCDVKGKDGQMHHISTQSPEEYLLQDRLGSGGREALVAAAMELYGVSREEIEIKYKEDHKRINSKTWYEKELGESDATYAETKKMLIEGWEERELQKRRRQKEDEEELEWDKETAEMNAMAANDNVKEIVFYLHGKELGRTLLMDSYTQFKRTKSLLVGMRYYVAKLQGLLPQKDEIEIYIKDKGADDSTKELFSLENANES